MPAGPSFGVWTVVVGLHGALLALLLDMAPPREAPRIEPTVWTQLAELPEPAPLPTPPRVRDRTPEVSKPAPNLPKGQRRETQPALPERRALPTPPAALPNTPTNTPTNAVPTSVPATTPAAESTLKTSVPEPARSAPTAPTASTATTAAPAKPDVPLPSAAQTAPAVASPSVTRTSPNPVIPSGATAQSSAVTSPPSPPSQPSAGSRATGNPGAGTPSNPSGTPSPANRVAASPARIQLPGCEPNQGDYPLAARDAEVEGTTRVSLAVDANGKLVDRQILRSAGPTPEHRLLDRVALDKLSRCRFTPGRNEAGEPVASRIQLDIVWRLD